MFLLFVVPAGVILICLNGVYHHYFSAKVIRNHVYGPSLKSYILKNTGWTVSAFESIGWEAYEKLLTELSCCQRVNWIKPAHDWQYMGHQKMHHKHESSSWSSPLNCEAQETAMYFCQCPSDLVLSRKRTSPVHSKWSPSHHQNMSISGECHYWSHWHLLWRCHKWSLCPCIPF